MEEKINSQQRWKWHQTSLIGNIRTIASIENYIREKPEVKKVADSGKDGDYAEMGVKDSSQIFHRSYIIPVNGQQTNKVVGLKFVFDQRVNMGEMIILNRCGQEMDELLANNPELKEKIVQLMFEKGSGFQVQIKDGGIEFLCPCCKMEVSHECKPQDREFHLFSHYGSEKLKTIDKLPGKRK